MDQREADTNDSRRAAAVRQAALEFCRTCPSGDPDVLQKFLAKHADLQPELAEEIQKLLRIERARRKAAERKPLPEPSEPREDRTDDDPVRPDSSGPHPNRSDPDRQASETQSWSAGWKSSVQEPRRLGSYDLLHRIGRGGFGEVWFARNRLDCQFYALKVLPKANAVELDGIREYNVRAKKNPYLVPVGPPDEADDCYFYHMPLADDAKGLVFYRDPSEYEPLTLRRRIERGGPLPIDEMLHLAVDMLRGLELLHACGGRHCDVKPDNIMQFDGKWMLGDQGLLASSEHDTADRGTPGFLPPDGTRDHTADVYALGRTMFLAVSGSRLDSFGEFAAGHMTICTEDPRFETVRQVILRACADRPHRYNHASEMLRDIEPIIKCPSSRPDSAMPLRLHFFHATPDDEHFVAPAEATTWLRARIAEWEVKLLAVTGFAGFGKTSLIAFCLKRWAGEIARARDGVFYWSFEEDSCVDHLTESLSSFLGVGSSGVLPHPSFEAILAGLNKRSVIIVLDGLHVHQQSFARDSDDLLTNWPGQMKVGMVTEARLRDFLSRVCQSNCQSLVVVTTRYPLPNLHRWLGTAFREFEADRMRLDESESTRLLRSCSGHPLSDEDCHQLWLRWDGYPLGLRMSAEAIKRDCRIPIDYLGLDSLPATYLQLIEGLRKFYESQLSAKQKSLLGVLSLFRTTVPIATIRCLAEQLRLSAGSPFFETTDELLQELQRLCHYGLVFRQFCAPGHGEFYGCQPALRKAVAASFQRTLCSCDGKLGIVEPSREGFHLEARQLGPLVHAIISCLLTAGEYARADEIMRNELQDGWLFLRTQDVQAGALCVLEFVCDEERRRRCEDLLSEDRLVHYLRMAGLFLLLTGNAKDAATYHFAAARQTESSEATRLLLNHSLVCSLTGDLSQAERIARWALEISRQLGDSEDQCHSLCCLAHTQSIQGRMGEADRLFDEAQRRICTACSSDISGDLGETDAVLWGWHLLRRGKAARVFEAMQSKLVRHPANGDSPISSTHAPLCQWLLAAAALRLGLSEEGMQHAEEAEAALRDQHALLGLSMTLIAKADAYRRMGRLHDAEGTCDEACRLAAERELEMVHGQALALLARIRLDIALAGDPYSPNDDLATEDPEMYEEAFRLFHLGYAMEFADDAIRLAPDNMEVRRDACLVKAAAARMKDDPRSEGYQHEADLLTKRLEGDGDLNGGISDDDDTDDATGDGR